MEIKEALDKNLVCILGSRGKKESILELISLVKGSGKVKNMAELEKNIFHRERLMSTGIGLGLAVPHTRMEGVAHPVMAVGVCPAGIKDYESIDGEDISILVLIVCGSRQHKEYISLLSSVVSMLKDKNVKNRLVSSKTAGDIFKIMSGF